MPDIRLGRRGQGGQRGFGLLVGLLLEIGLAKREGGPRRQRRGGVGREVGLQLLDRVVVALLREADKAETEAGFGRKGAIAVGCGGCVLHGRLVQLTQLTTALGQEEARLVDQQRRLLDRLELLEHGGRFGKRPETVSRQAVLEANARGMRMRGGDLQ